MIQKECDFPKKNCDFKALAFSANYIVASLAFRFQVLNSNSCASSRPCLFVGAMGRADLHPLQSLRGREFVSHFSHQCTVLRIEDWSTLRDSGGYYRSVVVY